jgi:hypothetical protein
MLGGLGVGEHGKWPVSHGNLARIEACRIRLAGAYGTLGMFQASWLVGWLVAYLNWPGLGWVESLYTLALGYLAVLGISAFCKSCRPCGLVRNEGASYWGFVMS